MKELIRRFGMTFITLSFFLIVLLSFATAIMGIGYVLFLPAKFLGKINETWAGIWFFFVVGILLFSVMFNDLRKWFVWQFIEPFKK